MLRIYMTPDQHAFWGRNKSAINRPEIDVGMQFSYKVCPECGCSMQRVTDTRAGLYHWICLSPDHRHEFIEKMTVQNTKEIADG